MRNHRAETKISSRDAMIMSTISSVLEVLNQDQGKEGTSKDQHRKPRFIFPHRLESRRSGWEKKIKGGIWLQFRLFFPLLPSRLSSLITAGKGEKIIGSLCEAIIWRAHSECRRLPSMAESAQPSAKSIDYTTGEKPNMTKRNGSRRRLGWLNKRLRVMIDGWIAILYIARPRTRM